MSQPALSLSSGIAGKTALVTGATGGIGIEVAKALARQGCKVMLNGLGTAEECELKRRDVAAISGLDAGYHDADLANPAAVRDLFRATEMQLGPVEILVNNAATRNFHSIDEMPDEAWDRALAINLTAPFQLIKLALPGMRARKWGRIINVASSWGLTGTVGRSDYVASKHGLIGLTKAVALEAMADNITCNSIAPGSVITPHAERQVRERMSRDGLDWDEAARQFLKTRQPSGRFVLPEKIADLIVFLCSDSASEMTGQPIAMDGGWLSI